MKTFHNGDTDEHNNSDSLSDEDDQFNVTRIQTKMNFRLNRNNQESSEKLYRSPHDVIEEKQIDIVNLQEEIEIEIEIPQSSGTCWIQKVKQVFAYEQQMKDKVDRVLPQRVKDENEIQKLKAIKIWFYLASTFCSLFSIMDFVNINLDRLWAFFIHQILIVLIICCCLWTRFKNVKAVYPGMIFLQIRMLFTIFQRWDITKQSDYRQAIYNQTLVFACILVNLIFLGQMFEKRRQMLNICTCTLITFGLHHRIYGYEDFKTEYLYMIINSICVLPSMFVYLYCNQSLSNIKTKQVYEVYREMTMVQEIQRQQQEIFESLQEGVVLIKDNQITYSNSIFDNIMPQETALEMKVFKVYRTGDDNKQIKKSEENKTYSLREVLNQEKDFSEDKIFELKQQQDNDSFKYILLKIKEVDLKTMVQIIDMSDKILYNEIKAEKQFLTLINATVSHELRNPLNSIICQRDQFESLIATLGEIIQHAKDYPAFSKIVELLEETHVGFDTCCKKIISASKIIDFYVHDILDYTSLCKEQDQKDFAKNIASFDIRGAINEIVDIFLDKIHMKDIQIDVCYKGYDGEYAICTDKKRVQQIILNILSNAVKFTDRDGRILLLIEKHENIVRISVTDSGIGIKRSNQDKLFKMFRQIKSSEGIQATGIGLGLVISKLIVNEFDGTIDFFSKYRRGSTFFFTIHCEEDTFLRMQSSFIGEVCSGIKFMQAKRALTTSMAFQNTRKFQKTRIMVVDDEEFCISAMMTLLEKIGINVNDQVDVCITGKEALDRLQGNALNNIYYKIILTDISMPIMDGIEATRRIREFLRDRSLDQPVIIGISGHIQQEFIEKGKDAGIDEILPKPMYIKTLRKIMKDHGLLQLS